MTTAVDLHKRFVALQPSGAGMRAVDVKDVGGDGFFAVAGADSGDEEIAGTQWASGWRRMLWLEVVVEEEAEGGW